MFIVIYVFCQFARECQRCHYRPGSCRRISAFYTVARLRRGYHDIAEIPRGTCSFNVTELKHSSNFLALKTKSRKHILNARRRINSPGEYFSAGSTITYDRNRKNCPGECIHGVGPLNETIIVQLLYYHTNPGVEYSFVLPPSVSYEPNKNIVNNVTPGRQRRRKRPSASSLTFDRKDKELGLRHSYRPRSPRGEYASFTHDRTEGDDVHSARGESRSYKHSSQSERLRRYRANPNYDSSYGRRTQAIGSTRRGTKRPKPKIRFVPQPKYISPHTRRPTGVPVRSQELRQSKFIWQYDPSTGKIEKVEASRDNSIPSGPVIQPTQFYSSVSEYAWKMTGFTDCSQSCGGGTQQPRVVCVLVHTQASVTTENCDGSVKPVQQTISCNTNPCPPDWDKGNWTACSVTCGLGTQTRITECKQTVSADIHVSVSASLCSQPKPAIIQQCEVSKCSRWRIGEWSECSTGCGNGHRRRRVDCIDSRGSLIAESSCSRRKPPHRERCSVNTCSFNWYHSKWSNQCSSECGVGVVSRNVHCISKEGIVVSEDQCRGREPEREKSCSNDMPCGGSWFASSWGKCSTDCGKGSKTRDVLCLKRIAEGFNTIVSEDNCVSVEKPTNEETCEIKNCGAEWYMSAWSRCSASCGDGYKARDVRCLDSNQQPGNFCDESDKPPSQETCNVRECPGVRTKDPSCKDRHRSCRLVLRARMCRYRYYKKLCCASCFKAS